MTDKTNKDYIIIALKLLIICAIVALIVAWVNLITKEKIAFNEKENTAASLTDIFNEDFGARAFTIDNDGFVIKENHDVVARCVVAECPLNKDVKALYVIEDSQKNPLFYCVSISPMGFKAEIGMLVAVNSDLTVKGVKIISMSETSGIGTKAMEPSFLSKFNGVTEVGAKNVDVISGATKTTRPVIDAVANACNQVSIYKAESGGANQ